MSSNDPLLKPEVEFHNAQELLRHGWPQLQTRQRSAWTYNVDLIFLVGAPRSGTTWLQAMLACHPAIYTGPEMWFFATFGAAEREFLRPKDRRVSLSEYLSKNDFYQIMAGLFWLSVSALPAPSVTPSYFLEKTTRHCFYANFILSTFTNAQFIHIIREARAVVASMLRASRGCGENWAPERTIDAARK